MTGTAPLPLRLVRGFTAVLLALVALGAGAYVLADVAGYERYAITGGSMSGTFEKGSLLLSKAVPVDELEVGDVITYLPPPDSGVHDLVTHRIVQIEPRADGPAVIRTQGDANADPDPWAFSLVQPTQAVGQVALPGVGYAFLALSDRDLRMVVVGVPSALIGLVALRDLVRALRPTADARRPDPREPVGDALTVSGSTAGTA